MHQSTATVLVLFLAAVPVGASPSTTSTTVQTPEYTAEGRSDGVVVVRDNGVNGATKQIRLSDEPVRSLIPLPAGKLAAVQSDTTSIIIVAAGTVEQTLQGVALGTDVRGRRLLTWRFIADHSELAVYDTARLEVACRRRVDVAGGVQRHQFAPDSNWVVVQIGQGPADPPDRRRRTVRSSFHLLNVLRCAETPGFTQRPMSILGRFSSDSRYYELVNPEVFVNEQPYDAGLRFNLDTLGWEKTQ